MWARKVNEKRHWTHSVWPYGILNVCWCIHQNTISDKQLCVFIVHARYSSRIFGWERMSPHWIWKNDHLFSVLCLLLFLIFIFVHWWQEIEYKFWNTVPVIWTWLWTDANLYLFSNMHNESNCFFFSLNE